jgi:hypothetical protein
LDGITILSPFGTLLFNVPLADDDIDESLEPITFSSATTNSGSDSRAHEADMRTDVEDKLGAELAFLNAKTTPDKRLFNSKVLIKGIEKLKACALKDFNRYWQHSSSTDHLKRVQAIPRFVNTDETHNFGPNRSPGYHTVSDDTDQVIISDPISTLVHVDDKFWLCLGEVNGLRIDGHPVDYISFDMLSEETVTISYQMLGL